jgi:hypothetical protein
VIYADAAIYTTMLHRWMIELPYTMSQLLSLVWRHHTKTIAANESL